MHVKRETSLVTIRRNFIEPGIGEITVNVNSTSGPRSASGYLDYLKFQIVLLPPPPPPRKKKKKNEVSKLQSIVSRKHGTQYLI